MGIILFVIFLLFGWIYNAPAREQKRIGNYYYDVVQPRNQHAMMKEFARQHDIYWQMGRTPLDDMNKNFYSDGSLRKDPVTGYGYAKGMYYCDSRGQTADRRQAGADVKRPPGRMG